MSEPTKLAVVWSTADKEVAQHTAFMYTLNSRRLGWWEEVNLIIWGPSGRLLVQDQQLQSTISEMIEEGVKVQACKACADNLGITDQLIKLGVEVIYIGEHMTKILKERWAVLTY